MSRVFIITVYQINTSRVLAKYVKGLGRKDIQLLSSYLAHFKKRQFWSGYLCIHYIWLYKMVTVINWLQLLSTLITDSSWNQPKIYFSFTYQVSVLIRIQYYICIREYIGIPAEYPFSCCKERHYILPVKWQISTTVTGALQLPRWLTGEIILFLQSFYTFCNDYIVENIVCCINHIHLDCIRISSISAYSYCNVFRLSDSACFKLHYHWSRCQLAIFLIPSSMMDYPAAYMIRFLFVLFLLNNSKTFFSFWQVISET